MFRATAAGPYDEAVAKATDENLTSEDWGAIIEVCDKVSSDQNGPKEVVQSMVKRLAHRNANVQLYTLELAHALCQNCGKNMHREISSRAFTDALLRLANDRNTHQQVKAKILEKTKDWSDMFSNDPDLGIMQDAYYRLKQSNPTLHPPSAPQKQGLTESDRQKEEDELQMALRLSLQEEERKKSSAAGSSSQTGRAGQGGSSGGADAAAPTPGPVASGTTAATVSRVRALYDFVPSEPGELEFKRGDVIAVLESVYRDWWRGSLKGKTGIFPLNYVEKLTDPTPDELQREAQMEAEVFAEIKNVEKLLTLLSASNTAPREEDNEEISKLYHQTLAIRPKLIKLIEKYSQKKDDFTQLNEKFIKARRDYEALLESSMSHPPPHNYQQYAVHPGPPAQGYHQPPAGYPAQPPQHQDPQRYYTPGPQNDQPPYPASSTSPSFQQQGTATAPFYLAGAEVPSQNAQQYPPRDANPYGPANSQQAPPPATADPPSPTEPYKAYSRPAPPQSQDVHGQRPQSTYGAQELATSVYDSPVAPYSGQSFDAGGGGGIPSAPYPAQPQQPHYQHQPQAQTQQQQQPQQPQQPIYQSYNPGPGPGDPSPQDSMHRPPLQPGGPGYDARHTIHGQILPTAAVGQPQYKPYGPPGTVDEAGAAGPGPPNDYYRQSGVY